MQRQRDPSLKIPDRGKASRLVGLHRRRAFPRRVADTDHKDAYKAAVALSPTNKELAHNLLWDYDATLVDVPTLLIAGAGGGDDWVVTGEQLESIYVDIPSQKFMARRVETDHGPMLYSAQGYVVAWFMWLLQGDEQAARAFLDSPGRDPAPYVNMRDLSRSSKPGGHRSGAV